MSDAISALAGAAFEGSATVSDLGPAGMLTLRGDLGAAKLKKAVKAVAGTEMPGVNRAVFADEKGVCWMSPDEVLILCEYAQAAQAVAALSRALANTHHLVANVSDARARIRVSGSGAREVLAKLTPADVSPAAFRPGQFRRSRLAQVPVAFWMTDERTIEVMCFRSVSRYVFDILSTAAIHGGDVGFFGD